MKFFLRELNFLFRFGCVFFLAAIILAFAIAVISKKSIAIDYQSSAVVEFLPSKRLGEVGNERFFKTECEKMASPQVLKMVADSQDLAIKWNRDKSTVLAVLEDSVTCERVEGTSLGRLVVTHHDPDSAYLLAKEIPGTYQRWRASLIREKMERSLDSLDAAINDQSDRAEAKRKVIDTIVRITGRPYFDDRSLTKEALARHIAGLEDAKVVELSAELHDFVEAANDYQRAKAELAQLKDEYFEEKSQFVPTQQAAFESLIFLEEPKLPKKPLPLAKNLSAPFFNLLPVTTALAAVGLVLLLFLRSFWWGRQLKDSKVSQA